MWESTRSCAVFLNFVQEVSSSFCSYFISLIHSFCLSVCLSACLSAINQTDFLCAVDLVFSSLAASDKFSPLSTTSADVFGSSHIEVLFGSNKLQV